jgi:hypothetical protein
MEPGPHCQLYVPGPELLVVPFKIITGRVAMLTDAVRSVQDVVTVALYKCALNPGVVARI